MKHVDITTEPIIKEVKGVNRLIFHIFFPIKFYNPKDVNKILLKRIMKVSSKKYKEPGDINRETSKLYIMSYDVDSKLTMNYYTYHFTLTVPREGIIDGYSLDKALEFFHEMIFNPCIEGNKFDEEVYNYEKNFLLEGHKDFPRDINDFAYDEYQKFIDPNEEYSICEETYVKALNETTPESVCDFYNKAIKNNDFFTYICGALDDKDKILNTFNKYFKQDYKELSYDLEFYKIDKTSDYEEKELPTNYKQSVLFLKYNIKDYTGDEFLKLDLLGWLISSKENDLLFKKLRHDHNLIYTYNFDNYDTVGRLTITVYLDYKDLGIVKKYINEVFDSIKDEKLFNECKERTLKAISYDVLDEKDYPFNEFQKELNDKFGYDYSLEEKLDKIKEITYSYMMEFIARIKNTRTMVIKGDANV